MTPMSLIKNKLKWDLFKKDKFMRAKSEKCRQFITQLKEKGHGVFLGTNFLILYNTIPSSVA